MVKKNQDLLVQLSDIQLPIELGNGVDLRVGSRSLLIVLVKFHWNLESLAAGDVSECMMGCSL